MRIGREKQKYSAKTCTSATLSTVNPTWPDLGSNSCRRGGKPATNRLSYGATFLSAYLYSVSQKLPVSCGYLKFVPITTKAIQWASPWEVHIAQSATSTPRCLLWPPSMGLTERTAFLRVANHQTIQEHSAKAPRTLHSHSGAQSVFPLSSELLGQFSRAIRTSTQHSS
jgi:hypothetical protein